MLKRLYVRFLSWVLAPVLRPLIESQNQQTAEIGSLKSSIDMANATVAVVQGEVSDLWQRVD